MQHTAFTSFDHSSARPLFGLHVETTVDALRLIMASRCGLASRTTRRLNDRERRTFIRSGAVFIFAVEESKIKRWTEGLTWSASRIDKNFLVYRETTERTIRGTERQHSTTLTSFFRPSLYADSELYPQEVSKPDSVATLRPNGLIKKTITVNMDGEEFHLVSYYREADVLSGILRRPAERIPGLSNLSISPESIKASTFRHPPHEEIGPDGCARIYDAEEIELRREVPRSSTPTSHSSAEASASIDTFARFITDAPSSSTSSPALFPLGWDIPPDIHSLTYTLAHISSHYDQSPQLQHQHIPQPSHTSTDSFAVRVGRERYNSITSQRSRTPTSFSGAPPASPSMMPSTGDSLIAIGHGRPATADGWIPSPLAQCDPSFSAGGYHIESNCMSTSDSSRSTSSPTYSQMDQAYMFSQSSSSFPPYSHYRVPSRCNSDNSYVQNWTHDNRQTYHSSAQVWH